MTAVTTTATTAEIIKAKFTCPDIARLFGKSLKPGKQHCIFSDHRDTDPSLDYHPEDDRFKCWGCNRDGDSISLYSYLSNIDNTEAFRELAEKAGLKNGKVNPAEYQRQQQEKAEVLEVYRFFMLLCEAELKKSSDMQNICDSLWGFTFETLQRFHFGYCSSSVYPAMVKKFGRPRLKQAGLMGKTGWKVFETRIIQPYLTPVGTPDFFCGRKTPDTTDWNGKEAPKYVKALTKSEKNPDVSDTVKNPLYVIRGNDFSICYITEGIADAIAIHIATGCTVISPVTTTFKAEDFDHIARAAKHYAEVVIANDNEDNHRGESGAIKTVKELRRRGIKGIKLITFPRPPDEKKIDANDYLRDHTPEEFLQLPRHKLWQIMADKLDRENLEDTITPIFQEMIEEEGETKAKIKAEKLLKNQFKIPSRQIPQYMKLFAEVLESFKEAQEQETDKIIIAKAESSKEEISNTIKANALKMAKNPMILEEISQDIESLGLVGEEENALMLYLSCTSRKMRKPIHVNVKGDTSTGKSFLVSSVISMFPQEEVIEASRFSKQALAYLDTDIKGKILIIQEEEGFQESNYNLRILQSEGKIQTYIPVKNPETGEMKTIAYEVGGPAATISTTNKTHLYEDNETRVITLYVDTSESQTRKVIDNIKRETSSFNPWRDSQINEIRQKHRAFQSSLHPLEVHISFMKFIDFPTTRTRARRDITSFISIIKAVAFLRQNQKTITDFPEGKFVEADLEDYTFAFTISRKILSQTMSDLNLNTRRFLIRLCEWWEKKLKTLLPQQQTDFTFNHSDLHRIFPDLSPQNIRKYMKDLRETPFIKVSSGGGKGKGNAYAYSLEITDTDTLEVGDIGITTPEELALKMQNAHKC